MEPALVVLAGGIGSRYGGLKQLEGVGPGAETIVDYSVFDSIRAGFKQVVFVVRECTVDDFKAKLSGQFSSRIDVEYVYQSVDTNVPGVSGVTRTKPWGTAHAVLAARDVVNVPFAVINADDYYGVDAFRLMRKCLTDRVSPNHYAMVGYKLCNTLSCNGSVSRAICEVGNSNSLISIVEHKKIIARGGRIVDQSLSPSVVLSADELVSMNFWGFYPNFFATLEEKFIQFATENKTDLTAEFTIPAVVDALVNNGSVAVGVLQSRDQWHGLTYVQDKATMKEALLRMTEEQLYPSPLWKK